MIIKATLTLLSSEREQLKRFLAEYYKLVFFKRQQAKLDLKLTDKSFDPYGYKKLKQKVTKLNKKLDKISNMLRIVKHAHD